MTYFTHTVKTENGSADFSFNKVVLQNAIKYHVETRDRAGILQHFTMQAYDGIWKIVIAPKPPEWIMKTEMLLSALIAEHLTTQ